MRGRKLPLAITDRNPNVKYFSKYPIALYRKYTTKDRVEKTSVLQNLKVKKCRTRQVASRNWILIVKPAINDDACG